MKKITKYILGGVGVAVSAILFYCFDVIVEAIKGIVTAKWINVPNREDKEKDYNDEDVIEIIDEE